MLLVLIAFAAAGCGRTSVQVPPPGSAAAPKNRPTHHVLFVQGFRGEPVFWDRFWLAGLSLLPAECELHIVTGLPSFMGAMEATGPEQVLDAFEVWLEDQGIPLNNLHIVAHSMGGLLARRFVTDHPGAARQVFLLGTPSGGVRMLHGLNPAGWCTPAGIGEFNLANPPRPRGPRWYVLAGDYYRDSSGGAFLEGVPNDGVVGTASVLHFVELCGDSVLVEWQRMPLTHPTWNWGENLLQSRRAIGWVLERIRADVEGR